MAKERHGVPDHTVNWNKAQAENEMNYGGIDSRKGRFGGKINAREMQMEIEGEAQRRSRLIITQDSIWAILVQWAVGAAAGIGRSSRGQQNGNGIVRFEPSFILRHSSTRYRARLANLKSAGACVVWVDSFWAAMLKEKR
jgi:hypothetical protein